jgi:hypothetical protein
MQTPHAREQLCGYRKPTPLQVMEFIGADCWGVKFITAAGKNVVFDTYAEHYESIPHIRRLNKQSEDARDSVMYHQDKLLAEMKTGQAYIIYMFGQNSWVAEIIKSRTRYCTVNIYKALDTRVTTSREYDRHHIKYVHNYSTCATCISNFEHNNSINTGTDIKLLI